MVDKDKQAKKPEYRELSIKFSKPKKSAHPVAFVSDASTVDRTGRKTLYVSGGNLAKIEPLDFIRLIRKIVRTAKSFKLAEIALRVKDIRVLLESPSIPEKMSDFDLGVLIGENFVIANYEFLRYKTEEDDTTFQVERVYLDGTSRELQRGIERGIIVGRSANVARDWSNTPAQDLTPGIWAEEARSRLENLNHVTVEILNEAEIIAQDFHLVHAVGKGSANPPRVIIAKYSGGEDTDPWFALVGKGVTYDTGGNSLKPSEGMLEMHMDMSGGAGVLAALEAVAKLGLKKNLVAVVLAVENTLSRDAQRPGDISQSLSGKTVEVQNTDAEGRLILADGLYFAEREYKPKYMIDVATLTGAAVVAVGQRYSGMFTKDDELAEKLLALGESCDDLLWRLPVTKYYASDMKKGTRASLKNIVSHASKYGGASSAAAFLHEFVSSEVSFAHLDIAPRMTSIDEDALASGATGASVRLLVRAIDSL